LRWYWRDHEWPALGARERLALERHNAAVFDRHVRERKPDLVAWWAMGGMSLSLIERARRAGLPALLFVHDYWPSYGRQHDLWTRPWRRRPALGGLVERLTGLPTRPDLAAAGRWLFNSECVRERTLAEGLRIADSGVLAPGIERSYLEAGRDRSARDWRWRLLYIGRVVEQKGVHTAIEAMAQLPGEAELRVIGDGDEAYKRRLAELADRTGVSARVSFEPSRSGERVIAAYREADAVLFPVEWAEPFGLVPLEAMALGRPVLATGRGGSGDYLRDGVNSLLFTPGDPAALAAALTRLASHPELRNRLRDGGLETARKHSEDEFNRRALEEMQAVCC
jgi:glycosyltransferase involved in cell wall biosynthesis